MTKADGKCLIDAVEVGELSYVGIGSPTPVLSVKYAYANAETGTRFGSGLRNQGWSERTLDLLKGFLASVEVDVVEGVFEGGATTPGVGSFIDDTTGSVPEL